MPTPGVELDTRQFAGTRQLALHATLSGGRGDTAWQHTQLFRSDILMWSVEWMHKCARIINSTFYHYTLSGHQGTERKIPNLL